MQEIRYELERKLSEPVDLEQEDEKLARMREGMRLQPQSMNAPHAPGLNRKQRRKLARERV